MMPDILRMSIFALRTNLLRSALTILGIVIGIASVIGMLSLTQGLSYTVEKEINSLGGSTFFIQRWPAIMTNHEDWHKYERRKEIEVSYAEIIRRSCPAVKQICPTAEYWTKVKFGKESSKSGGLTGTDENFMGIKGYFVDQGRNLLASDIEHSRNVCILGRDITDKIFPYTEPIGQEVRIEGRKFTVVGLLERKGQMMGQSMDNVIIIPISTFQGIWGNGYGVSLAVIPQDVRFLSLAMDQVMTTLRRVRGVKWNQENDFELVTQSSILEGFKKITGGVFFVVVAIAAISLLVGGIGIMNIMYVSVTERTREIGIRKAVGARRQDILWQFLTEAVILSAMGGVLGLLFGLGVATLVKYTTPLPVHTPLWAIVLALGFSSLVGLFFGIYPAVHASKLDPIESLRYE